MRASSHTGTSYRASRFWGSIHGRMDCWEGKADCLLVIGRYLYLDQCRFPASFAEVGSDEEFSVQVEALDEDEKLPSS